MVNAKVAQSTDFNHYQLLNALLHLVNGSPTTPSAGQVWYDTATGKFMYQNASAAIDATARANHSGTQVASTISNLATTVQAYSLSTFAVPTADLSLGTHKLTGLTAGSATGQAVEYDQLNTAISTALATATAGITYKAPVRIATTANITLSAPQTIDSVAVIAGQRVLVKNQSTASQNGIYLVAAGSWTRTTDADSAAELEGGVIVPVDEGTTNANTMWMLATDVTTLGTDSITWTQFGSGTTYTASLGVQLVGSDIRANLGTGLTLSGNTIVPDYGGGKVFKQKTAVGYVATTGQDIVVNHAFSLAVKEDLVVRVYEVGVGEVQVGVLPTDVDNVTLSFGTTPTTNQYRYSMVGLS